MYDPSASQGKIFWIFLNHQARVSIYFWQVSGDDRFTGKQIFKDLNGRYSIRDLPRGKWKQAEIRVRQVGGQILNALRTQKINIFWKILSLRAITDQHEVNTRVFACRLFKEIPSKPLTIKRTEIQADPSISREIIRACITFILIENILIRSIR